MIECLKLGEKALAGSVRLAYCDCFVDWGLRFGRVVCHVGICELSICKVSASALTNIGAVIVFKNGLCEEIDINSELL